MRPGEGTGGTEKGNHKGNEGDTKSTKVLLSVTARCPLVMAVILSELRVLSAA